jgi:hypothetical protein
VLTSKCGWVNGRSCASCSSNQSLVIETGSSLLAYADEHGWVRDGAVQVHVEPQR